MANFENEKAVIDFLKDNLGYCSCASENVVTILLNTLRIIEARSATGDVAAFSQYTKELRTLLHLNNDACDFGLGEWFIYLLESKGLIVHHRNIGDCWITDDGKDLLRGLNLLGENFRLGPK